MRGVEFGIGTRISGAEAPSLFSGRLSELKLRPPGGTVGIEPDGAESPAFAEGAKDGATEKTKEEDEAGAPRRGMLRAVKTCSTMRAIVWRSGTGAAAAAMASAGESVALNLDS
jgi:hypothetical protein